MRSDWRRTQRRSDWRRLVLPARKPLRSLPLGDRRPFKLSKALCAAAHSDAPCLAVGGLKSSSGSYLVQVAQSLPRPDSERPTTQYACRLRGYDAPTALSWRNECASSPAAHLSPHSDHYPRSLLLCGGTGRAYLFKADPAELAKPRQGKHAIGTVAPSFLHTRCYYRVCSLI